MVDSGILLVSLLTGFIPAYFLDKLIEVKIISPGKVIKLETGRFVSKKKGTLLMVKKMTIIAGVTVVIDNFLTDIYTKSDSSLWLITIAVVIGIVVLARVQVGGKYSKFEQIALPSTGVLAFSLYMYAIVGALSA